MGRATQSLYHYTEEFLAIRQQLEEAGVDEEVVHDTLEAYEDDLASKMENVAKYHRELLAIAELQKAEAKKLELAARVKEANAESVKRYLDHAMKATGAKEVQAGAYRLWYRKGSPIVEVDESRLPEKYFTPQPPKPWGKPELKKLLDAGEEIEGVCLKKNPDTLQIQM